MKEETITATGEAVASIDAAVVLKIAEHYCHAKRKHPYFADRLLPVNGCAKAYGDYLRAVRDKYKRYAAFGKVPATAVLEEEIAEVYEAIANGDKAAAVEECYDAIAVLLRMVDVLEGRQSLGNPNKGAKE